MAPSAPLPPDFEEGLRRQVARAAARLCPSFLANERDDIVQVAMMRILATQSGEGSGRTSASYIWKTAYSVTIDEIRKRSRRPEAQAEAESALEAVEQAGPSPEASVLGREVGMAIRGCLTALAPQRRAAAVLHLQGHSVPEIAQMLGWGPKQADNTVYRALAGLRECLRTKGVTA